MTTEMTAADLRGTATDDQIEELRTCFHESGHAVACALYGGQIHRAVVLRPGSLAASGAHHSGMTSYVANPEHRRTEVTFAGIYAEARWTAGPHPAAASLRASMCTNGDDDRKLRRALAFGNAGTGAAVVPMLERCWPAVVTLARRLFRDSEAGHDDVLAALGVTDGGGPGSFQLANIRAGMRLPVAPTT